MGAALEVSRRGFLGTAATSLLLGADIMPGHCEPVKEDAPATESGVQALAPPPAPAVFSTPFGDEMPGDTDDYLIFRDTVLKELGSLNGLPPGPLIDGEISGKRVLIQENSAAHKKYDGRKDLHKLVIIADTLEIRSPFWLPQTAVEIYARAIIVFGDGRIVTTPVANTLVPGERKDGNPGLPGGSLLLFIKNWYTMHSQGFFLQGAAGQPAGPGRAPQAGKSMPPLPTDDYHTGPVFVHHHVPGLYECGVPCPPPPDPNYPHAIVYLETTGVSEGDKDFKADGTPGVIGGKPGEGGAGGDFTTNLDDIFLRYSVDNRGGDAGKTFEDSKTPGNPGTPNPSYRVYCHLRTVVDHAERVVALPGPPVTSPQPDHPQGPQGQIKIVDDHLAWVRPRNIEAVLLYAEDLFLSRRPTEAGKLFEEYAGIVTEALASSPKGENAPALTQLLARLKHRRAQVALGMDYYGNPPGWVPLLSLEVTTGVYSAELDRAAKALYLNFWFTRKIGDATARAAVLELLLKAARDKLAITITDLNKLVTDRIPTLKDAFDWIVHQQDFVAKELMQREGELREIAASDAARAKHAQQSIAAMHLFAAVLSLVPVAQPAGAILGASLEAIAKKGDLWTIVKSAGTAYLTSAASSSVEISSLTGAFEKLDFSSYDALKASMDAKPTGLGDSRGEVIRDAGIKIYSTATDLLAKKASDTVPADLASQLLAQYEASDPEYQGYISDAKALLLKKQETFAQLQDLQQQAATMAQDVGRQIVTIEASVKPLRDANLAIDTTVLAAVADLSRDAERRLRKYLYLIALAYEYRLLEPYRSPLTVKYKVQELQTAADANETEPTPGQVRALLAPYEEVLSQVTQDIIDRYNVQQESQLERPITLNKDECARLGKGEKVEINLAQRGGFDGLSEENLRLVNLQLLALTAKGEKPEILDLVMRHEGVSLIKLGDTTHGFRHRGYDGEPLLTWTAVKDFKTGHIKNSTLSAAENSILQSVMKMPPKDVVLFMSPGLDAGVVLSLEPKGVHLHLTEVRLNVIYSYLPTQEPPGRFYSISSFLSSFFERLYDRVLRPSNATDPQ